MTFDTVAKILATHLDKDVAEIKGESTFESLGLDSLDTVEIVMELEDEFGVTIELNDSVTNVEQLVALIDGSK